MSKQTTSTVPKWLTSLAALALLLCLASCEMPPTTAEQPQQTQDQAAANTAGPIDPDAPVGVMIHRIDLPLNVSLDNCWAQVDESTLPTLTNGMWRANGMRIGVLHADQAQAFAEALPATLGESRAKLLGSSYPTAIRNTPRLLEPVPVDLTDPPRSPTIYRAVDGRLQLLAKIMRFPETGQPYVEITPHHYKPKADLIPRSPLDKALDGKVFTPLTARVPLTQNTAVVVGLYRPWPQPLPPTEVTAEPSDQAAPTEPASRTDTEADTGNIDTETDNDKRLTINDQRAPDTPPIPDGLGKSLMAGIRAGHETQILIVFTVIEE